jgi:hypothetical protein
MLYERDLKLHNILASFDANPPMPDPFAHNQQMTHAGAHTVLVPVAGQPRRKPFTHPQKTVENQKRSLDEEKERRNLNKNSSLRSRLSVNG